MADAVTVRTRNLIKNPLLKRRQFVSQGPPEGGGARRSADETPLPLARPPLAFPRCQGSLHARLRLAGPWPLASRRLWMSSTPARPPSARRT